MNVKKKVELLAPAGSPEALVAAVESGANAVYLGLKQFNARGNAVNFSHQDLGIYVPFAHSMGTRVYLTLNTLVKMDEMGPILESLRFASDCGIDGVILQDLGLSRIIAKYFPHLRRHASTQLAVHNLEGVGFCVEEGFERVVLARELTLAEIAEIRQHYPSDVIELEVFCHGAMCYTYSGLCFFSGSVGGRSGNRGECAYTCRKGYKILNETSFPLSAEKNSYNNYLFSMKDMNTLDVLPQLIEAGVDSLKIEGRRKGPSYVSASVKAYRGRMEQMETTQIEHDLSLAFGRKYTQAFYQRGQFGDAPVDLTTTSSQGIQIGVLDHQGSFFLGEGGIQKHDGICLVHPDRTETRTSFTRYRVDSGDRMRPAKGARVWLETEAPEGTLVMWVHSQSIEQQYRPDMTGFKDSEKGVPLPTVVTVEQTEKNLTLTAKSAGIQEQASVEVVPSTSGKPTELKSLVFRFGDSQLVGVAYAGPDTVDGFVPKSKLKQLRRDVLGPLAEKAEAARAHQINEMTKEACAPIGQNQTLDMVPKYVLRIDRAESLEWTLAVAEDRGFDLDFLMRPTLSTPVWNQIVAQLITFSGTVRIVLPMILRKWDLRLIRRRIEALQDAPFEWVLMNPGHFNLLADFQKAGKKIHADFSIYHLNTWAVRSLIDKGITGRFTLSLEDDFSNMKALLQSTDASQFEVIAYTDTPLFIAEACSLAALYGGCPGAKTCGHETLFIENQHGDQFEVRHDRCRSTVIGKKPLSWSGRLHLFQNLGVGHFRIDFTVRDYGQEEMEAVIEWVLKNQPVPETHTENLERVLL